jgi:cyclopropane-fatty-acyl-phospholipid synthase
VFPDGELHTQAIVVGALERAGFELLDDESLRPHYAETLRRWAANHDAHREAAVAEIGAERERVWRLHNVGAALGFERGSLSIHQVLARPLVDAPAGELRVRAYPV